MSEERYKIRIYSSAYDYINSLSQTDQAKIKAAQVALKLGNFNAIETRLLRSPVKELKVKKHRITFFIAKDTICFLTGFTKKTSKTPPYEITQAYYLYELIIQSL